MTDIDTITKRWKAGLKWDRERAPADEHKYRAVAFINAQKWLTQAAAGEIPSGGMMPSDTPGPYLDYTVDERPGRND